MRIMPIVASLVVGVGIWLLGMMPGDRQDADMSLQRTEMIAAIVDDAKRTAPFTGQEAISDYVLNAMEQVPRHRFVEDSLQPFAYLNRPLPIGQQQTISQPFIVALMTDLLRPEANHRVLEIGTGSGYQAAVLAELVDQVFSIEIIPELGEFAAKRLKELGYLKVEVKIGDGYHGWPQYAPFDGIVVTAAAPEVPQALIEQLKPGGRLVIPVGVQDGPQNLLLFRKDADGELSERNVLPVSFVPFTRDDQS